LVYWAKLTEIRDVKADKYFSTFGQGPFKAGWDAAAYEYNKILDLAIKALERNELHDYHQAIALVEIRKLRGE